MKEDEQVFTGSNEYAESDNYMKETITPDSGNRTSPSADSCLYYGTIGADGGFV